MVSNKNLRTELTGKSCRFYITATYEKDNDYEVDLSKHNGEACTVGFFDGECYNAMFSDGSSYDVFPEELILIDR